MDNKQDFTNGSIPKKMLRFMFPILGAQILQAMYSAVDLLIVGRFGSTAGISGVSVGSSILHLFTFSVSALTTAVTVLIGQYIGEKKKEKIGGLLGSTICFFTALAVIISVVLVVFAPQIAQLLKAPEEALDLTVQYVRICGAGFIFVLFYNFISAIFRGTGNSRLPLIFVAIACVTNIFGDLLLVAVFKMNAAGAAIATVAAQAISVILSLVIIRKLDLPFKVTKKDLRFGPEIKKVVRIGTPMALQEVLTSVTFLALCAFINKLGLEASSGYGVAQKLLSFTMLIPGSIMQSMSSFVAQNVGAKREDRAKSAMKFGMLVGCLVGIGICYIAFFHGDILASLFTDDSVVIARAAEFLRGFAPDAILTSIMFSFLGYFNGHARSLFVMAQSLAQSLLVRLPLSYVMSIRPDPSLTGIGLAAPAATVFGIVLCIIYYIRMNRKGALTEEN